MDLIVARPKGEKGDARGSSSPDAGLVASVRSGSVLGAARAGEVCCAGNQSGAAQSGDSEWWNRGGELVSARAKADRL